jgi:hypothetical protein
VEVDNQFRAVHSGSLPLHALIGPALARALRLGAYLSVAVEHPAVAHGRDAVLEEVVA